MPPRRPSSRTQQPAQRRPRIERACNFCRIAKLRCEPTEYGTNDRPCRRCVSQGLDCNLPRAARSQSPSLGPGAQSPGPIQSSTVPYSTGGATEELTPSSEIDVQYTLQQSESIQASMRRWSPLMMHPQEQQQGPSTTTILPPGQTALQTASGLPAAPGMISYQQSFANAAQGSNNPESGYYPQEYYGQPAPGDAYMVSYGIQSASDGTRNLGYAWEDPRPDDAGGSVHEQDEILSQSDES